VYSLDGQERKVDICIPTKGAGTGQPEALIARAMQDRRTITQPAANGLTIMVIPIQSKHLSYGALWMELHDRFGRSEPGEEVRALVNEAAQTVERMFLLEETREQARTLERTNRQLAEALRELEQSYDQTIQALMRALDARDSETEDHSWRVTELSVWLGQKMGLSVEELRALRRGAMLHDLGKIGIRDHVLLKPGRLNDDEWDEMRKHPENGVDIIRAISPLSDAIPIIIGHQERWDGSGYPRGRKGEEIPLLARLFAVIDVYDALTSKRVYRDPRRGAGLSRGAGRGAFRSADRFAVHPAHAHRPAAL
jgi:HD-GYP domain-containing protein (c-di-GMP phosphodiesterase class II)